MSRRGFVLISVLWIVAAASVLASSSALVSHDALSASANRSLGAQAFWSAYACTQRLLAAADETLRSRDANDVASVWLRLPREVLAQPVAPNLDCEVSLEAAGTRLDANTASDEELARLFTELGEVEPAILANRVIDWRDTDDFTLPGGAESSWYIARGRRAPSNAPFVDDREISLVAGLEDAGRFRGVLGVETGAVALNFAPAPVLRALPGMTREAVDWLLDQRAKEVPVYDILSAVPHLSRAAGDSIRANHAALVRRSAPLPAAWIATVTGEAGSPPMRVSVQVRLAADADGVVVTRFRTWP